MRSMKVKAISIPTRMAIAERISRLRNCSSCSSSEIPKRRPSESRGGSWKAGNPAILPFCHDPPPEPGRSGRRWSEARAHADLDLARRGHRGGDAAEGGQCRLVVRLAGEGAQLGDAEVRA